MIATKRFWAIAIAASWCVAPARANGQAVVEAEVLVYGGTPSGIAAALAAAESGHRVELVEPYGFVGGLMTNGLTHTDFHTFEGLTGTVLAFTERVRAYYAARYGPDSPQVADSFRGTHAEPHVNRLVFERMLAEYPAIRLRTLTRLLDVEVVEGAGVGASRIVSARFGSAPGGPVTIRARQYIDATYEGDLMAAAGVPHRVGREGRDAFGESLAPERADGQVQGYNFRLTMTREPGNRVPPSEPPGYRREDYLPLIPLLGAGRLESVFCESSGGIYKAHVPPLPNGKRDINDVSRGLVRLSMPAENDDWPGGDWPARRRIFDEHLRHNVGMLYFLQTDPLVPEASRDEASRWGLCLDEYPDNGHLPEQLYVREGRRMIGRAVFTEHDTDPAPGDARAAPRPESIAIGEYSLNCHGTGHEGPRIGGRHTGEFYKPTPPYQVPFGVIVPRDVENLLVPVACSASHVGFCALRLEPIWMALGQAAGHAAHLALRDEGPVGEIAVAALQARLHADGSATIYTSDVPPDSPDFAAVQWWGTAGGLHGLAGPPDSPDRRGPNIVGQYFEAYPGHAAGLGRPLDDLTRERWLALAEQLGIGLGPLRECRTRGEWIAAAYQARDAGAGPPLAAIARPSVPGRYKPRPVAGPRVDRRCRHRTLDASDPGEVDGRGGRPIAPRHAPRIGP